MWRLSASKSALHGSASAGRLVLQGCQAGKHRTRKLPGEAYARFNSEDVDRVGAESIVDATREPERVVAS